MKHSWDKTDFKAVGPYAMYISRDVCKNCGAIRFGFYFGKWLQYNYFIGPTELEKRPDCKPKEPIK